MKEPQVMEDALETRSEGLEHSFVFAYIITTFILSFMCGFALGKLFYG